MNSAIQNVTHVMVQQIPNAQDANLEDFSIMENAQIGAHLIDIAIMIHSIVTLAIHHV